MAKAVINLQKESGGIVKISPVDGIGVTEVTVPESGELVTKEYADTKVSKPELISITGTATFNGTTQNINLTNIGNITLAIGDVIEVAGTTNNNKLFRVESIIDNNNIVVNYEHRGTSTPIPNKRLINETASNCTIKLYNRAKNAPLGQGCGWCTPASSRTAGVTYTANLTIVVSFSTTEVYMDLEVDSIKVGFIDGYTSVGGTILAIIEKNSTYKMFGSFGSYSMYRELR